MGKIWSGNSIYFDDDGVVNFDTTQHWDTDALSTVKCLTHVTNSSELYVADETGIVKCVTKFVGDEDYAKYVDLLQLVPEKFRSSTALQEFLYVAGLQVGSWIGDINEIEDLIDKYNVGDDYIQYLADLVGLKFLITSTTTLEDKRRQLIQVVDWYKMKGTYQALKVIGYTLGLDLNLWDMYTNDYSTFVMEPWYAGALGTNPPGLDSSYYKSPHFGIEILLNQVYYGLYSDSYLFDGSTTYSNLSNYVERVRPINVVPHYSIFLNPITTQSGAVATVYDGDGSAITHTIALGVWTPSLEYFDESNSSGVINHFDDGLYFDYTATAFYNNITVWRLGTGNKGVIPDQSFTLQDPVLTNYGGSVTAPITTTVTNSYVEFSFQLPSTLSNTSLSELGLYYADGTTIMLGCTFPNISLAPGIALRVVVRVNFSS